MFINKKSHKSAFVCIAVFMVTMIMILTFYQLAVEIYAYGFITKNNDYRVKESTAKVLTLKENHKDINKKNINVNGKIKSINNKAINADQEMLTTSIVNKNDTKNVNNFVLKKPVKGGITTSGFGDTISRTASHNGHDWAVNTGTKVRAAAEGVVELAYFSESYGYNILINHNNGFKTRYAHLSEVKVSKGEKVEQSQVIALSGSTGFSTGPHLHFEVVKDGKRVNPIEYVSNR
ncbi:M23 family peptidase [Eubacterium ventriosum]|jgi:murein DD-endopeptidase MepM/ murein hydrolase activator NlpD|uniref:M23 family peptidase n=1 Tax=Eubacterium ventriosum TaxID=39496 RepID=A0A413RD38_9FIRM|nr:M23 family metallopeptidase [Eubacterium ventriosum]MCQ5337947.1 M23 family metallopeptidase [Eubacterium ventriosum]RHA20735.1 M23 family peptidase [Eubacterium ventriosum]RHB18665.1 M23 family peptidase [Eubacterium ventriosum]